jgi:outer membrane protein assembly factor BamA
LITAALLASLAFVAQPAPAAEATTAGAEPAVVDAVEIEGNRRTSGDYLRSLLGVEPGQVFDPTGIPALERRLLMPGIFRSARISLERVPSGTVLRVEVAEKLTVVPIPFLAASSGVLTGGAVVLDSDFLGAGKQVGVGVLASSRGTNGFAGYRDPGVGFTRWTAGVRLRAGDGVRERFEGDSLAYRFRDRRIELDVSGGYRLDDRWEVEAGWVERREQALPTGGYPAPPGSGPLHGPGLAVSLEPAGRDDWLNLGFSGRLELRQTLRLGERDREVGQAWSTVIWSGHGWRDHGVSFEVSLDAVNGDPVLDAVRLGGAPGSRGFPTEGLWVEESARAALEYQIPIWKPRWGVWTAVALCDAAAVRWRGLGTQYVAPGVGFRVYLRNIAIPVLGLDLAWATGLRAPAGSVRFGFGG